MSGQDGRGSDGAAADFPDGVQRGGAVGAGPYAILPPCSPSGGGCGRCGSWGGSAKDIRSEDATFAIDLIVRVAKRAPSGLPKRDAVIIAAIYMPENQAAVSKVAEGLDVNPRAAEVFFDRVRREAIEVAKEEGLQEIAERGRRVRMRSWQDCRTVAGCCAPPSTLRQS